MCRGLLFRWIPFPRRFWESVRVLHDQWQIPMHVLASAFGMTPIQLAKVLYAARLVALRTHPRDVGLEIIRPEVEQVS